MKKAAGPWAVLLLLPAVLAQTLTATNFVPYYNYEGLLAVAGTVTVTCSGTTHTLDYDLTSVEAQCAGSADSEAANSCGIHVHEGTTCDDEAGSHYYEDDEASDPWASITYASSGSVGSASGTTPGVDTGMTSPELVGRALIVHGYDGGRIACALLKNPAPAPTPMPTPAAVDWEALHPSSVPNVLSVAAGTTVTFTWSSDHNVYEVDATAYDDCDFTDATQIASMSVGGSVDVAAPDAPTTRYYVCTVGSHCDSGQKIAITWAPLPTDASAAPTPAPTGDLLNPAPTAASVPSSTAQSVVIALQLVLAEVSANNATFESVVKAAPVATLSYISSPDDIVAFSVVASRRRRLQSTYTVSFSVRVAAATLASDVATALSDAAESGALNTLLAIAADAEAVDAPTAPAEIGRAHV